MKTTPEKENALAGLAIINGCLSPAMQQVISVQQYGAKALDKRQIDFQCIDRAVAAAERLVDALGPDAPVLAGGVWRGTTPAALLASVRGVAQQAAPYRPTKAEARRA